MKRNSLRTREIIPIFFIMLASLTLLSGCQFLDDLRAKILKQGETTIDSIGKKAEEIGEQVNKTKQSVEQKIQDVKDAAKEVKEAAQQVDEAISAVKKVTGGETSPVSGTSTGTTTGTATGAAPSLTTE